MLRSVAFCIYLLLGVSAFCAGDETAPAAFNPNHVYDLRIELPPEPVSIVKTNSRKWARATLLEAQTRYKDVGLHLKGQGTFQPLEKKPNFVLKMNQFVPGQRLWGLRKLMLNNSRGDSSYLSAWIGNECFRAAGLPAPWCGFARVSLNGRDLGLYVVTEGITQDFLERYFHNHSGNLYQGTIRDIDQELDCNSGKALPGQPDLKALLAATREPDLTRRLDQMGRVLDLDKFISFMAMEMLLVHGDGYCLRKNNYRIYHDPASDRLVFIPHDMDYLFGDPLKRLNMPMTGLVARAIMEVPGKSGRMRASFPSCEAPITRESRDNGIRLPWFLLVRFINLV